MREMVAKFMRGDEIGATALTRCRTLLCARSLDGDSRAIEIRDEMGSTLRDSDDSVEVTFDTFERTRPLMSKREDIV